MCRGLRLLKCIGGEHEGRQRNVDGKWTGGGKCSTSHQPVGRRPPTRGRAAHPARPGRAPHAGRPAPPQRSHEPTTNDDESAGWRRRRMAGCGSFRHRGGDDPRAHQLACGTARKGGVLASKAAETRGKGVCLGHEGSGSTRHRHLSLPMNESAMSVVSWASAATSAAVVPPSAAACGRQQESAGRRRHKQRKRQSAPLIPIYQRRLRAFQSARCPLCAPPQAWASARTLSCVRAFWV